MNDDKRNKPSPELEARLNNQTKINSNIHRTPGQVAYEDLLLKEGGHYCTLGDQLYEYKENHYQPIPEQVLKAKVINYFDGYVTCAATGKTSFARSSCATDAIRYIKSKFYVDPDTINPPGLNLDNGYLKLSYKQGKPKFELVDHLPQYIFTYKAKFGYDEKCDVTMYQRTISAILDDAQKDILLNNLAASIDLREVRKKQGRAARALILFGQGSNGKDTIKTWTEELYGQNGFTHIPLQAFRSADNGRLFGIYDLIYSRINWPSENISIFLDNCQTLKSCITGDSVTIEKKLQQGFTVNPKGIFIFNANTIPKFKTDQEAILSRYGVIKFSNVFKKDPDLNKPYEKAADPRMKEDRDFIRAHILPAMLNDLLSRFAKILENGIDYSANAELLDSIREDNSHLVEFLNAVGLVECNRDEGTQPSVLYDIYEAWCIDEGLIIQHGEDFKYSDPGKYDRIVRDVRQLTKRLKESYPNLVIHRSGNKRTLGLKTS